MNYYIHNIRFKSIENNPVKYSKVIDGKKWETHKLENSFTVILSNGYVINFKKGFLYDRASVPQLLWGIVRPDDDDDIAYLIHDWLYKNKQNHKFSRTFCDQEMKKWAKAMKKTINPISWDNIDIQIRYIAVKIFGRFVWNKT